jgi:thiamine-phosphate pyrophosphorylase
VRLPDPPLLLITDRQQALLPLADVVRAALATGCRWVSMREKDLSEVDQVALARTLLSIARRHGACLTLHGDAALAKACGADGVHLPAGSDPIASRAMLGPAKLIGVSLHTVTEAEAIDPNVVDYAIAGPIFETPSKPGYGPEIGRKGLAEIARAAPVPVLAIGGLNATRAAEVLAAGPVGIAVMGGVMRAADPGQDSEGAACDRCGSSSLAPDFRSLRERVAKLPLRRLANRCRFRQRPSRYWAGVAISNIAKRASATMETTGNQSRRWVARDLPNMES